MKVILKGADRYVSFVSCGVFPDSGGQVMGSFANATGITSRTIKLVNHLRFNRIKDSIFEGSENQSDVKVSAKAFDDVCVCSE